jgi:hypothetical protein
MATIFIGVNVIGCQGLLPSDLSSTKQSREHIEEDTLNDRLIYFAAVIPDNVQIWQTLPSGMSQEIIYQVPRGFVATARETLLPKELESFVSFLPELEPGYLSVDSPLQFYADIYGLTLSPNGEHLAWWYSELWCLDEERGIFCFGTNRVDILNLSTGEHKTVFKAPEHLDLDNPLRHGRLAWSPDSKQIAFVETSWEMQTFGGSLKLLDTETLEVRTLSENDNFYPIVWSEDGQTIATTKTSFDPELGKDVSTIKLQSLDNDSMHTIPLRPLSIRNMEWGLENQIIIDGEQLPEDKSSGIGLLPHEYVRNIYLIDIDSNETELLLSDEQLSYTSPQLSPNKQFVAVDGYGPTNLLRVFDIETKDLVAELLPDQRDQYTWVWGPNSEEILVRMSRLGRGDFGIFSITTGEISPIPWPSSLEQYIQSDELWIHRGNFVWY